MANSISDTLVKSVAVELSPHKQIACSSVNGSPARNTKSSDSYITYHCNKTPDDLSRSYTFKSKPMSPAASSGPFCRICHEGDGNEDLISLCKCTGSVGLVHLACMEKWLSTRRGSSDKCEICNFAFTTIRTPKSMLEWYKSDQGNMANRHGILGDITCFALITPLASVSAFLCFEGAKRQVMSGNSLEAGCLIALATFLVTIYLVWNILTFRYHFRSYLRWRSVNQNVRLVCFRRKSTSTSNVQNVNIAVDNEIGLQQSVANILPSLQSEYVQTINSNLGSTDTSQ